MVVTQLDVELKTNVSADRKMFKTHKVRTGKYFIYDCLLVLMVVLGIDQSDPGSGGGRRIDRSGSHDPGTTMRIDRSTKNDSRIDQGGSFDPRSRIGF